MNKSVSYDKPANQHPVLEVTKQENIGVSLDLSLYQRKRETTD